MKRSFCDCCENEITGDRLTEITKTGDYKFKGSLSIVALSHPQIGSARLEKIEAQLGLSYSGDLCKYCIIDLINQSDERPRILIHNPQG